MLNFEKSVPQCYLVGSRDFQMLVRLLTIGISSAEHDSKTLLHINNPRIANSNVLPLLLTKIGLINSGYEYTDEQMIHICDCFKDILRRKGSIQSIKQMCMLYSACFKTEVSVIEKNASEIYITYNGNVDEKLLDSLIKYVLPVGTIYNIQNVQFSSESEKLVLDSSLEATRRLGVDRSELAKSTVADSTHKINTTQIYSSEYAVDAKKWEDYNLSTTWQGLKTKSWSGVLLGNENQE